MGLMVVQRFLLDDTPLNVLHLRYGSIDVSLYLEHHKVISFQSRRKLGLNHGHPEYWPLKCARNGCEASSRKLSYENPISRF